MDFLQDKGGRFVVPLKADENVVITSAGERTLAKFLKARTANRPEGQDQVDLLGDAFWMNFQNDPILNENPSPGRAVNKTLLEWMYKSDSFDNSHSRGNTMRSLITAAVAWQSLVSDQALQDALDKQAEASEKEKQAQEKAQEAAQAAKDGNGDQAAQLAAEAQQMQQDAQQMAQQAVQSAQQVRDGTFGKQIMSQVIQQAKQEGERSEQTMRAWGLETGTVTVEESGEVLDVLARNDDEIEELTKMIGRLKGIARESVDSALRQNHSAIVEAANTTDVLRLFPTEVVAISPRMPEFLRARKLQQLTSGGGLLGWRPIQEGDKEGAFIGVVDDSGSMYWGGGSSSQPWVYAKGIALGIAGALAEEKRTNRSYYEVFSFSGRNSKFPGFSIDDPPRKKLEWANTKMKGGTDFDSAIKHAIERVKKAMDKGKHGIDVVMITDGISMLSEDVVNKWQRFQEQVGARLFVVNIGSGSTGSIEKIAEVVVNIDGAKSLKDNADDIVRQFVSKIVKDRRR